MNDDQRVHLSAPPIAAVLNGSPIPSFVIDAGHVVTHWNLACEELTGVAAADVVGRRSPWDVFYDEGPRPLLADLVLEGDDETIEKLYAGRRVERGRLAPGSREGVDVLRIGGRGRRVYFVAAPIRDDRGRIIGAVETIQDVTEAARIERQLRTRTEQVQRANRMLETKNAALEELISGVQRQRDRLGEAIQANVEQLVLPMLDTLRAGAGRRQIQTIEAIEAGLREIASPLLSTVSSRFPSMTGKELRICQLIRRGMTTKEIAAAEGVSPETIKTHRERIRRKLGISGKSINLTAYLQDMPDSDAGDTPAIP